MDKSFVLEHCKGGHLYTLVGAGGKSTAMKLMGKQLLEEGYRVILSTTTHLQKDEFQGYPCHIGALDSLPEIQGALLAVAGEAGEKKYNGYSQEEWEAFPIPLDTIVLVEGDGSRRLPFKVPYSHEPVVPRNTARIFLVLSAAVFGKEATALNTYNLEGLQEAVGPQPYYTPEVLETAIRQSWLQGGDGGSFYLLLNGCDHLEDLQGLKKLLQRLRKESGLEGALVSCHLELAYHREEERLGAIVLAAGEGRRMGRPKQLLELEGETFLSHSIRLAGYRGQEILVALGYYQEEIQEKLPPIGFRYLPIQDYQEGMGGSLRESVFALSPCEAFLVFPCDLPFLEEATIAALLRVHRKHPGKILVPRFGGRNGHPVLFPWSSRELFHQVQGDAGGREIIKGKETIYVDLDDPGIAADIDSPEEYMKAGGADLW